MLCLIRVVSNLPKHAACSRHYFKDHRHFIKVFKKLDKEGSVIAIEEKDIIKRFHGAGTKGGQHANHNNTLVLVTHIPTGIKALGDISRSQPDNLIYALSKVRMQLDIETYGDKSIFCILEKEHLKKRKIDKNVKYKERKELRENEAKLKHILSQPDLIKY